MNDVFYLYYDDNEVLLCAGRDRTLLMKFEQVDRL